MRYPDYSLLPVFPSPSALLHIHLGIRLQHSLSLLLGVGRAGQGVQPPAATRWQLMTGHNHLAGQPGGGRAGRHNDHNGVQQFRNN